MRVTITISNHIADVRLNRPAKMNALDSEMFEAIIEAGENVAKNSGVRCVVLSGEGKAFCAGMDTANFSANQNAQIRV